MENEFPSALNLTKLPCFSLWHKVMETLPCTLLLIIGTFFQPWEQSRNCSFLHSILAWHFQECWPHFFQSKIQFYSASPMSSLLTSGVWILELSFTAWSLYFNSGPLPWLLHFPSAAAISLWHTCWHLLPLFTEQSPLQSSYPNPHIFSRSPPIRTTRLLCNPPGLQLLINLSQGILFRIFNIFLMWKLLIHWNWTFVEQEAG